MRVLSVPVLGRSLVRARYEAVMARPEERKDQVARLFHSLEHIDTEEYLNQYSKPMGAEDWDTGLVEVFRAFGSFASNEAMETPGQITQPVLLLFGDQDQVLNSSSVQELWNIFPNSTARVIRNCGHCPAEGKLGHFGRGDFFCGFFFI